jgi:hypothetical protein
LDPRKEPGEKLLDKGKARKNLQPRKISSAKCGVILLFMSGLSGSLSSYY